MSLETISTKRKRVYQRKFDHDLAIEMHQKGFTYSEIVRHLGNVVTVQAVARVCDPKIRERMDKQVQRNLMSNSCMDCGARCSRHGPRCKPCAYKARQTRFITDENDEVVAVRCSRCRQWKPPTLFSKSKKSARGYYQTCRTCSTNARREYRNRIKVPCLYCGAPALPASEKGPRGGAEPRCRDCYVDHARLHV